MERFRKFWYAIMSLIDDKWRILFDKYRIEREIEKHGRFYITADQIREVKEPRLMTKFDTRESLPRVFGKKISILPVSRGGYVLGEFDLYQDFPEIPSGIKRVTSAKIPDYFESIDLHDIRSEASAINVMSITGILDDFLGEDRMVQTVSGRMGSGNFEFYVSDYQKSELIEKKPLIQVQNSQVEIDGGFENENVFTLIEGKNVVHSNFLIRQLYYPERLWAEKIHKPIRPVFMVYSNNIFRLLEYEFTDLRYYNSLRLVQERNYSLEEIEITLDDLDSLFALYAGEGMTEYLDPLYEYETDKGQAGTGGYLYPGGQFLQGYFTGGTSEREFNDEWGDRAAFWI